MDAINKNILLTFFFGIVLCYFGFFLSSRVKNRGFNILLIVLFLIISLPSISFIIYYLHLFNPPIWYIDFRSFPKVEILSAFLGVFIGYLTQRYFTGFFKSLKFSIPATILLISIPFIKPIISPITKDLPDDWSEDVCLQSCGSTCGPSSLATIFKYYGISKTEMEIAENCHSCATGTEIWYLIRYARENKLLIKYVKVNSINEAKIPSILGTTLRKTVGHFVTLLGKDNEYFIIGDPLTGRVKLTEDEFNQQYDLNNVTYWIIPENY